MIVLVAILAVWQTAAVAVINKPHFLSDEYIDLINSSNNTWVAGRNFAEDTPIEHIMSRITQTQLHPSILSMPQKTYHTESAVFPENFDPRKKWKFCASLTEIRDQGSCGSCWAVSAVSAITDRICIASNGTETVHLSAEDVIDCTRAREPHSDHDGCHGGAMYEAFEFWNKEGIVSGGNYNSREGCKPYASPSCDKVPSSKHREPCRYYDKAPKCEYKCRDGYNVSYVNDKSFGGAPFYIEGEYHAKRELYNYGPLITSFDVYDDFLHYKKGVYKQNDYAKYLGAHAVKLLGWGVEDGTPYWLAANSWNEDWGDHGYFKIRRGQGDCGFAYRCYGACTLQNPSTDRLGTNNDGYCGQYL